MVMNLKERDLLEMRYRVGEELVEREKVGRSLIYLCSLIRLCCAYSQVVLLS